MSTVCALICGVEKLPTRKAANRHVRITEFFPSLGPRRINTLYLKIRRGRRVNPAVPLLKNFAAASPDEFRADLPNARGARPLDVTEVPIVSASHRVDLIAANFPAGIVKLRVVEDVEEFTSNLEMHGFI